MKLLCFIAVVCVFQQIHRVESAINPSSSTNIDSQKKDTEKSNITNITNYVFNKTREEDYCSFTKLEKKIIEVPDPEICLKINDRFKDNENFDFINDFGELFGLLKTGIESLKFPANNTEKNNIIFFIGNTGSGKSTLVQILGADNSKIFSTRPHEHSTDFTIDDYSKIGTDTVTSQTLYPELLVDNETGFILVDNPGFRDTRSPVHEIIAVYGMRKVLRYAKKIKLVLVSTHSSLKVGMYRDDFPNLLKHLTDFFHNVEKYKNSIYLIGTKAENTVIFEKGVPTVVSDSAIIRGTSHFLTQVRSSLSNNINLFNFTALNKDEFIKKSIKVIDALLEKTDETYNKIKIMRRPAEEGPLSEIALIQDERNTIRDVLLNAENMVEVEETDFGFPLTDSAVIYLNEIFEKMNSFATKLSEVIGDYMMDHYANVINSNTDIDDVSELVRKIKESIKKLSRDIGAARNPGEYAEIISTYSQKNKLNLDCLSIFKNISTLNEYLINLEDLSASTKYSPISWSMSMKKMSEFIESKTEQYQLLDDVFRLTSTYNFQKNRHSYSWVQAHSKENVINENNLIKFLKGNNLNSRYELVAIENNLIQNLNTIIDVTLKHKQQLICQNGTLTFIGYFVLLSEMKTEHFESCSNTNKIVILAMHTVFIDRDLKSDWFGGKQLTIIAPIWETVGTRRISVDGANGGEKEPKAGTGKIGKPGRSGLAGGYFMGIGKSFKNGENLIISACGGNGQDGQDGGDGEEGWSGSHGSDTEAVEKENNPQIYVVVNFVEKKSLAKGQSGHSGGDAGAGGIGGYGGDKGSAVVYNIGNEPHTIQIKVENGNRGKNGIDGKPGKGGIKGCDKEITEKKTYILFIPVSTSVSSDYVNCNDRYPGGKVQKSNENPIVDTSGKTNNDSPVCIHIMKFQDYYVKNFHSRLSDGITKKFLNKMKQTKY